MQKIYLLLLLFLFVSGWNWQTHRAFVESIYYSSDDMLTTRLNLTALQVGAITPDKYFHDTRIHSYPHTVNLSSYWLGKAKEAYKQGDFQEASYAFGIASHYISDTYAAPHNVQHELYSLHKQYEDQASAGYLVVPCSIYSKVVDLDATLFAATHVNSTWEPWITTKDTSYPEKAVQETMKTLYPLAADVFQTSCVCKTTTYVKGSWLALDWISIILVALVLYFTLSLCSSLVRGK